jgi:hypothetical protein
LRVPMAWPWVAAIDHIRHEPPGAVGHALTGTATFHDTVLSSIAWQAVQERLFAGGCPAIMDRETLDAEQLIVGGIAQLCDARRRGQRVRPPRERAGLVGRGREPCDPLTRHSCTSASWRSSRAPACGPTRATAPTSTGSGRGVPPTMGPAGHASLTTIHGPGAEADETRRGCPRVVHCGFSARRRIRVSCEGRARTTAASAGVRRDPSDSRRAPARRSRLPVNAVGNWVTSGL